MLCEHARSLSSGAFGAACHALVLIGCVACAGSLDDPQRFQQTDGVHTSGPSTEPPPVGDTTQMLPVLPATEGVDPLPPVPAAGDGGAFAQGGSGAALPMMPAPAWPPPAPACVLDLFASRCAGLECHGPGAAEVDLLSPGVADRLVDKPSSPNLLCAGRTYVATDGTASLLLDKLGSTAPCGSRMPLKGNIGSQHVTCLVEWVASLQRPSDFDAGAI